MKTLAKAVLLISVFLVTFLTPAKLGRAVYFGLFGVMFLCVWVWFYFGYYLSEKQVRKVCSHPFAFSLSCGMVPLTGGGDLIRGRLVITEEVLELYRKGENKEEKCVLAWSLDVRSIRSIGFGKVLSSYPGLFVYVDSGDVRFVSYKAKKQKNDIIAALGWKNIPNKPMDVTVEGEAASAPSFHDASNLK